MTGSSADADAIAFGTDGWRATLDEFTTPRVRMVAQGVATALAETGAAGPVAVGYDARPTSPDFARAVADVLATNGRDVWLADRDCPTPATAWLVREEGLAGGIVITASHNPPDYNGIKFLPAGGAPALPETTDRIVENLVTPAAADEATQIEAEADEAAKPGDGTAAEAADRSAGEVVERDFVGPYLDQCASFQAADLGGLTVAYDAMHGSGRGVTDALLERAGASVDRLRCARDAEFGGTPPEPAPERVPDLVAAVAGGDADLGVVNDGDADRIGVVTPARGFLDPNLFLATIYDFLLESRPGDVVRTVSTSSIVDRVADAHGASVHEVAVGFKWVARAMQAENALVGGEESGGYGITRHLPNKDGVLLALVAAAAEAERPIDDRVDDLLATHGEIHQGKVSVDCPDERKGPVIEELEGVLPDEVAGVAVEGINTVDGFKVALADGTWVLIRPSGTEPKMRVYAEAGSEGRVDDLLAAGRDLVEPLV
jgi:phosphomannomutase